MPHDLGGGNDRDTAFCLVLHWLGGWNEEDDFLITSAGLRFTFLYLYYSNRIEQLIVIEHNVVASVKRMYCCVMVKREWDDQ